MVGLDIQDENGRHEVGHIEDTEKTVLNDGKGCNFVSKFTINKVRDATLVATMRCHPLLDQASAADSPELWSVTTRNLSDLALLNQVPGNFHVSTHAAKNQPDDIDMSHEIHSLTFGDQLMRHLGKDIKGSFNALQNHDRLKADGESRRSSVFDFFLSRG